MAKVDLKHLHTVRAGGRVYRYAWRGGPRMLADPADPVAFADEYASCHAARVGGDATTLAGLCAAYRASDDWKGLSAKTRTNWSPWLDKIQVKFGALPVRAFDRPLIRKAIKQWRDGYKATPRAADVALQVLSRLLSYGVEDGRLALNACAGIAHLYRNDRSDVIWTAEDLDWLERGRPDGRGGREHAASKELLWAAKLAVYTGMRQADCLKLSWSHVGDLAIEMRTGKSGGRKTALVPMHTQLRALLEEIPRRSTRVLTNQDGLPWKTGFGSSWGKATTALGIDKHFHDLRGTAATVLYLADFSIREIAEIMTWSEDRVEALINRYVKRDELLRDRIRRLDSNAAGTAAVKIAVKPT